MQAQYSPRTGGPYALRRPLFLVAAAIFAAACISGQSAQLAAAPLIALALPPIATAEPEACTTCPPPCRSSDSPSSQSAETRAFTQIVCMMLADGSILPRSYALNDVCLMPIDFANALCDTSPLNALKRVEKVFSFLSIFLLDLFSIILLQCPPSEPHKVHILPKTLCYHNL